MANRDSLVIFVWGATLKVRNRIPTCFLFVHRNLVTRFAAACGNESEVQDASVKRQEELQMMPAAPPSMRPGFQTFVAEMFGVG